MNEETKVSREEINKFKKTLDRKLLKKRHTWDVEKSLFVVLEKGRGPDKFPRKRRGIYLGQGLEEKPETEKPEKSEEKQRTDTKTWLEKKKNIVQLLRKRKERIRRLHPELFEKSRRIWVPPSGRKKGYFREDPREKHEELLSLLKNLLSKILGLKKQGLFTDEQRKYAHRRLQEIEPRLKHFKTQGQRMAVAKALKEIRKELEEKTTPKVMAKDGKVISDELRNGLKRLGYTVGDIKRKSLHEIKAIYYNEIERD